MHELFGGSESHSSSTPQDVTPAAFKGIQQPLADALLGFFQGGGPVFTGNASAYGPIQNAGSAPAPASDPFTAALSPATASLLGQIGAGGGSTPGQAAANDLILNTLRGNYLSPSSNPFLAATIKTAQQPIIDAFNQTTVPQLKSAFLRAGQRVGAGGSSAFDKAAAIAENGLLQNLSSTSTSIAAQNYEAERQRQAAAATQPEQISTQELNNLISRLQATTLPTLIQQQGIQNGLQEFNNRVNALLQVLGLTTSATRPVIANQSSSSSDSQTGVFNAFANVLSALPKLAH